MWQARREREGDGEREREREGGGGGRENLCVYFFCLKIMSVTEIRASFWAMLYCVVCVGVDGFWCVWMFVLHVENHNCRASFITWSCCVVVCVCVCVCVRALEHMCVSVFC